MSTTNENVFLFLIYVLYC